VLKQQILSAIDDCYVSMLQDHATDLIAHLVNTYSNITLEVLEQNCNNPTAEWNPNDRIKTIFT
jgi:hypothetical protein